MTGEPGERKPSTSRGELPPLHTVAPKFSRSLPDLVCEVLIPHDGSGTRSGRAAFGGVPPARAPRGGGGARPPGGFPAPPPAAPAPAPPATGGPTRLAGAPAHL